MLSSALGHRRHVLVSAKCTPPPRRYMHVICDILEFIPNAWCFVKQRCLEWLQPPPRREAARSHVHPDALENARRWLEPIALLMGTLVSTKGLRIFLANSGALFVLPKDVLDIISMCSVSSLDFSSRTQPLQAISCRHHFLLGLTKL